MKMNVGGGVSDNKPKPSNGGGGIMAGLDELEGLWHINFNYKL